MGEEPPAQAIASLQAYVSHLRRLLEPDRSARTPAGVLISQPPGYRLVVAPDDVDVSRFEALAARGRSLLEAGEHQEAAAALAEGLELWRGRVLADFPDARLLPPSGPASRSSGWSRRRTGPPLTLALGRHAAVIAELERLVADHPFREGLHGRRMLALYRSGRQAEALNAYQVARRALRQELGIDPSPQLRQLEADILRQAPQLDWMPARLPTTAAAPPLSTEARGTDLVGREEQLGVLEAALADAAAGQCRLVLVAGEPGIGKTRLAEEGVQRATRDGVAVAWGRCWEEQGAPPFWPWVQVLRELLADMPPARLPAVLGSDTPDLVQLLPELGERGGAVPSGPVLAVETVRFRLCHAVMALLGRLASSRPVLLVLDDLQWADAASLRLLSMLGGALRGAHILIVATFRSPDADGSDRLAHTLAALARAAPMDRMVLRGLSSAHVSRMMAAELGAEPKPELARVVHDRTDGNPFFVVELLRLLGSGGQQAAALEIPAGVRDVLRRRLAQLPEQTNAVLLVAAISGREFDLDTVMAVTKLDDDQALEAVEAARCPGWSSRTPTPSAAFALPMPWFGRSSTTTSAASAAPGSTRGLRRTCAAPGRGPRRARPCARLPLVGGDPGGGRRRGPVAPARRGGPGAEPARPRGGGAAAASRAGAVGVHAAVTRAHPIRTRRATSARGTVQPARGSRSAVDLGGSRTSR